MEITEHMNACPRCGLPMMKHWDELTDDERFIVDRLESSVDTTRRQRRKHRYCTRCWFEDRGGRESIA